MKDNVVDELTRLGMVQYEAMAYVALVGLGEGTARQIHEESGVPRTRIYDILDLMEEKGYVEVFQSRPKSYRAIPVERLLHIMRDEFEESVSLISKELSERSVSAKQKTFPVWHIKGSISIKKQISDMIKEAKKELTIVSPRVSAIRPFIEDLKALKDPIDVVCVSPGSPSSFKEDLPNVRFINPTIDNDTFAEMYHSSFMSKSAIEGTHLRVEMLVIVDGKRSILTYYDRDEQTGVVFELPIITMLQKGAIKNIISGVSEHSP